MAHCIATGAIAVLLAACASSPPAPPVINVANESGITVVVAINGSIVGPVAPGFHGPIGGAGAGGNPRKVDLTTAAGTPLSAWDASGAAGEDVFDMGPECGMIWLWLGDANHSFDPAPSVVPGGCPN